MHTSTTDAPRSGVARRSLSRRNVGANPVSPILAAASVGGRPAGGTARLVSSQPAADRQQRSSGQPGGAPRHARHASRFAGRSGQTESSRPPCADRDGRSGTCDAPVAPRQGGSAAASRGVEQRGARSAGPVRCSGAVLLRARWITATATAPRRPLCCPPDRPGPLRVGSGQWTSAVSRCVGATGRLAGGRRAKVSLFPKRSIKRRSVLYKE